MFYSYAGRFYIDGNEVSEEEFNLHLDAQEAFESEEGECPHGLSLWLCEGPNHYPEGL